MFRYWHCPILVHQGTYRFCNMPVPVDTNGAIFGTELCQFQYGHTSGPVPGLHSEHTVPFPVMSSASSGLVIHRVPLPELHSDTRCHFWVLSSASYGTVICRAPVPELHSEHKMPFPVLIFCEGAANAYFFGGGKAPTCDWTAPKPEIWRTTQYRKGLAICPTNETVCIHIVYFLYICVSLTLICMYSRIPGDQGGPLFFKLKIFLAVIFYKLVTTICIVKTNSYVWIGVTYKLVCKNLYNLQICIYKFIWYMN